jgi:hypothetical protein
LSVSGIVSTMATNCMGFAFSIISIQVFSSVSA